MRVKILVLDPVVGLNHYTEGGHQTHRLPITSAFTQHSQGLILDPVVAAHVGSMATSTTDGQLMVYDDGDEGVFETQRDAAGTRMHVADRRVLA